MAGCSHLPPRVSPFVDTPFWNEKVLPLGVKPQWQARALMPQESFTPFWGSGFPAFGKTQPFLNSKSKSTSCSFTMFGQRLPCEFFS